MCVSVCVMSLSICVCPPCARAMRIFPVSLQRRFLQKCQRQEILADKVMMFVGQLSACFSICVVLPWFHEIGVVSFFWLGEWMGGVSLLHQYMPMSNATRELIHVQSGAAQIQLCLSCITTLALAYAKLPPPGLEPGSLG